MKQLISSFILISIIISCSASTTEMGDYSYNLLRQEVEVGNPKVYIYEVRVGQEASREMTVYAHNNRDVIYFIIDNINETGKNSYAYKTKEYLDNFHNYYRGESVTITSFDDAMDKAVSYYIQDNLLPGPQK